MKGDGFITSQQIECGPGIGPRSDEVVRLSSFRPSPPPHRPPSIRCHLVRTVPLGRAGDARTLVIVRHDVVGLRDLDATNFDLWVHCLQRRIDSPAGITECGHLRARQLIQVMRTDNPCVRFHCGRQHASSLEREGGAHPPPVALARATAHESLRFEPMDLLGHPTGYQHQGLRQVPHTSRLALGSGQEIEEEDVEQCQLVQFRKGSIQRLIHERRRIEELLPGLLLGYIQSGQTTRGHTWRCRRYRRPPRFTDGAVGNSGPIGGARS